MIAVRDHLEVFADAAIAVVTFAPPERLAAYRALLELPFPVLSDVERRMYRLLGVERGSWRAVWSPSTIRMYARLIRRGRRVRLPAGDVRQLGADAVVGRDGRLRAVVLAPTPDARPTPQELIELLD